MSDMDALTLADQAVLIGLVSAGQAREAVNDSEDGSLAALSRAFLRKGLLTSWQIDRLQKNDPTGFFFGGCKVLFHLAEGTFARVYRGERQDSRTPVAVKVLRNRFVIDPASVARFNKEAESGMKLSHPNIVRILSHGEEDKRHYMIMEYVEGSNLRDFLKIRGRMGQEAALPLIMGLSRGLQYSIANGVTHRDIKGTNILVSTTGEAKLVDFGLAAGIEGDERRGAVQSQRTVDYSALERTCKSEKGDPRSDIFFLGCVFYQMLTGKVAMAETESKDMLAKMLKRSFGAIQPLSDSPYAPDPELCRIIEKMMKVELRVRYASMDEVVADLEAFESRGRGGSESARTGSSGEHDFMADIEQMFLNRHAHHDDAPAPGAAEAPPPEAAAPPPPPADDDDEVIHAADEDEAPGPAAAPAAGRTRVRLDVLCVESQGAVQDVLRKSLSKLGYRVILVGDAERAAERFRESPPDAVVFDVDGLGAGAIDSFIDMHDKAREDGHDLAALILMGPRHLAFKNRLPTDDRLIVLAKPVKMKQIQDALARLMPSA